MRNMRKAESNAVRLGVPAVHATPPKPENATVNGSIRISAPESVKLVANAAVKNQLDMKATVKQLAPNLTPYEMGREISRLQNDPRVQEQIQIALEASGLDEQSKTVYVRTLWEWYLGPDKDKAQTAARILGKGFISEKVENNKPMELKIVGFEEGVRHMLGEDQDEDVKETPNE